MFEAISKIKSTRVFTDQPIDKETKREILKQATLAPTAGNMMMYAMIDVTDQAIKEKLAISCDNQPFIKDAPMVVVFCSDNHRFNQGAQHFYQPDLNSPGPGDFLLAVSDTLIVAHQAVLTAHLMGIGSCYIGDVMENYEYHQELLQLPNHVMPVAMVVFGYPTQSQIDRMKPGRFDLDFVLHTNTYQTKSMDDHQRIIRKRNEAMKLGHIDAVTYYKDYVNRKYNSDFMAEMNRSVTQMMKQFL